MKKLLVTLAIVAAGLTVTIGARGHTALPMNGGLCLPGTEPGGEPPEMPYHAYLPSIFTAGEGSPPPLVCDAVEIETNDTHTDAQMMLASCVEGTASWDGDPDWYRLEVCSPVDLRLTLEGPDGTDLDLYLHGDPPGWPLYSSESIGSDEEITATNVLTGTYYALVQPVMGQGDYVLDIGVARGQGDKETRSRGNER